MLAMVVALLSVSVPAMNAIDKVMRKGSRIVVSNPSVHGQQISFVVTNLGLDPGTIDGGLMLSDLPGIATLELADPAQAFILPGSSKAVTFTVRIISDRQSRMKVVGRLFEASQPNAKEPRGFVIVMGRNFDESPFKRKLQISGPNLFTIHSSFERKCNDLGDKADIISGCIGLDELTRPRKPK